MKRPITICSGQFGDLSFEELCQKMSGIGYEGIEVSTASHIDVNRVMSDDSYVEWFFNTLDKNNLKVWALGSHLTGQCVGDKWDPRLDNFAPNKYSHKPDEIRAWAIEDMKTTALAAKKLGIDIVTGFLGSPIWGFWYSYPQTTPEMVEEGFRTIKELWDPIFDVFDECGVKFALEVHPAEIAFDYYSTKKLFETFDYRKTLGLNFDPSHFVWQGVNPVIFIKDFSDRIYHVHMKDVKMNLDGRAGILGSHLQFGDTRRAWNFVTLGHGNVDFDAIIRELNQIGYHGPLSVEWEDSGMERMHGATEAFEYATRMNFEPSTVAFDAALKTE